MKVLFKTFTIKDFKGIRDFTIDFKDDTTEIFGGNGTGKSTILDALYWLFYNKNSLGKKKFDIEPLDSDNNVIEGTDTSVKLSMLIDEELVVIERQKGKTLIDEVPKKVSEFSEFIEQYISEKLFMTLVSPIYFGDNYEWKEQKELILDSFQVEDTIILKEKYKKIAEDILKLGTDNSKIKFENKVKTLKNEVTKDMGTMEFLISELDGKDFPEDIAELNKKKDSISETIIEFRKLDSSIVEFEKQLNKEDSRIQKEENEKEFAIRTIKQNISKLELDKVIVTTKYKEEKSKLNLEQLTCSACGNKITKEKIEENLALIIKEGKEIANKIETLKAKLINKESKDVDTTIRDELAIKIKELKMSDNSEKIEKLEAEKSNLEKIISSYDTIIKHQNDLKEVKNRVSKNNAEKDIAEGMLELIKSYHMEYSELVSKTLNDKLDNVKIRTFYKQKDGTPKETFEITMHGVPYKSLNSAGKITAGIELIQLIKESLDIDFPIVIDNKESITKDFNVSNQLITLTVKKGAKLGV